MAKILLDRSTKNKKRKPPNKISVAISTVNTILLLLVVVISLPIAVPRAFGYQPYTVISGSMEPAIPVGSLAYVKNCDPVGITQGEVAAFYKDGDPGTIIVHRVTENDVTSGLLTTKGDANAEADFEPVKYSDCLGVVAKSVPKLGAFADVITSTAGKACVFCLVGLAAAAQLLASFLDYRTRKSR